MKKITGPQNKKFRIYQNAKTNKFYIKRRGWFGLWYYFKKQVWGDDWEVIYFDTRKEAVEFLDKYIEIKKKEKQKDKLVQESFY